MHSELVAYRKLIVQAVGLIILGYFGFSVADLCAKLLQQNGYKVPQILFVSGMLGACFSGTWVFLRHGWRAFFPHNVHLHIIRGVLIFATAFLMVSGLKTLPLADFYGVTFLMPFVILIMSVLFLHERVGWRRWSAVAVGFVGVFVLAGPQFDHLGIGFVMTLVGVFFGSAGVILLRKFGPSTPLPLYGFYPSFFIGGLNGILMLVLGDYVPFRPEDLHLFAIHGPAAVMGVLAVSMGYARSPEVSIVAPFLYTQIIWGIFFGWYFFAVMPVNTTWMGLVLVIGAGCYSIWRDYQRAHDKHPIIPDIT